MSTGTSSFDVTEIYTTSFTNTTFLPDDSNDGGIFYEVWVPVIMMAAIVGLGVVLLIPICLVVWRTSKLRGYREKRYTPHAINDTAYGYTRTLPKTDSTGDSNRISGPHKVKTMTNSDLKTVEDIARLGRDNSVDSDAVESALYFTPDGPFTPSGGLRSNSFELVLDDGISASKRNKTKQRPSTAAADIFNYGDNRRISDSDDNLSDFRRDVGKRKLTTKSKGRVKVTSYPGSATPAIHHLYARDNIEEPDIHGSNRGKHQSFNNDTFVWDIYSSSYEI